MAIPAGTKAVIAHGIFGARRGAAGAAPLPVDPSDQGLGAPLRDLLGGCSIEVMPRTAAKIDDFRSVLPAGTRVYVAHIDGTSFADMLATCVRLRREGFEPMPHVPARLVRDRAELAHHVAAYRGEADVRQALLLGGGISEPRGAFDSSMQMIETGLFDGFERLHLAGHPEGSRDIDPDGSETRVMEALSWKQDFANRTDAQVALTTQFLFDAPAAIAWAERIAARGIDLPIHIGVAGPAKLQTLIKFAIACGVGPSLKVLQRRARDVTRLLTPFTPDDFLAEIARHKAAHPDSRIEAVHFFPLGGITPTATWIAEHSKG